MAFLGMDIGTSGCKATVMEADGTFVASHSCGYEVKRQQGLHEIDGQTIWKAARAVIAAVAYQASPKIIEAISISSFGETAIPVDNEGKILATGILYTDPRGQIEAQSLANQIGDATIARITGVYPHGMYTLPKIMDLKSRQPQLFDRVAKVLLMEDFIIYQLTGQAAISYSLATRTMGLDIQTGTYSSKVFDAAMVSPTLFSPPVASGTRIAKVKKDVATETGLHENCWVCTGGHDQVCAAIGAAALTPNMAVNGTGTVECVTPVFKGKKINPSLAKKGYVCVPYVDKGEYVTYAFTYTGGVLRKWYKERFVSDLAQNPDAYSILDASLPKEPTGLLLLPHFAGAATPYMNPHAKGAIMGLTLETTKEDLLKAIMEGIAFEMRHNMQILAQNGIKVDCMRVTGGAAVSAAWLQMKANILNIPLCAVKNVEAGTVGAIMLAACGADAFSSLDEAANVFVKTRQDVVPQKEQVKKYDEIYDRYLQMSSVIHKINR